ncbi:MFS transporter [Mycobacterium sp. 236(2023)]|uniref:MFS transporter n=1 Tax=Mycobacterium sp. 236(2023) TaxID=3038163 RepID=UPI002414F916|nr:MFS transporter [Mycobacterium sp. 236(2023)]MDG4667308.1 MFS transporter [Mycobacterium sp. 236(2023)]
MPDDHALRTLWRSVRALPEFRRLLELRAVSQFADGLFQAGLAGAILFNPEREAEPWAIAAAFAVLFLPYSLLGPFAGALLDRWDRRLVLLAANTGRLVVVVGVSALLAAGVGDIPILLSALVVNGFTRFVSSGMSAALPHVVPRAQVIAMNSVYTATGSIAAFGGVVFMLVPRWLFGAGDSGGSVVIVLVTVPVALALWLSKRFPPRLLGPDDSVRAVHGSVLYAVATGWVHGLRTVIAVPTVTATLGGLAAHRMAFGINTMLVLVMVRHAEEATVAGFGTSFLFLTSGGAGLFLATLLTPWMVKRWGRYVTPNGALVFAAGVQLVGATLNLPVMIVCGFLLGAAGQVVKLCADTAMQVDVDDALRGHLFAVQDSLFWVAYILSMVGTAAVIPPDGRSPALAVAGSGFYLVGLAVHATVAKRRRRRG